MRWSETEKESLILWSDQLPLSELVKKINDYRRINGMRHRSTESIRCKLVRMGLSTKTSIDWFTKTELARCLDVNRERVQRWCKQGLKVTPVPKNYDRITVKDFKEFAEAHPKKLAGVKLENLVWMLGKDLANQVYTPREWNGEARRIVRLDSGKEYRSITGAAYLLKLDPTTISQALRTGCKADGSYWKYK